jgi:mono/diheme cytochrome c family protein
MPLVPIMPYAIFHNMTDDDANAIVAYLRTVPGVNHTVPPNEEPWLDWNNGTNPPAAFFDPANIPAAPTTGPNAASAQNGRYLSSMAGLCIDCHTPVDPSDPSMITLDHTAYFTGGRVFTADQLGLPVPPYPMMINSRNLTSDQTTGIGTYTMKQIEDAITLGKDPQGDAVCAATHGSGISPYAGLTPSDLDDITNYLMSLPAVVHDTSPNCQGPMVP